MLDYEDIAKIVGFELSNSSQNDTELQTSLEAYLGDSPPVPEGRSGVVSTDIADAIEWIMPEVMKAFTQNNEVVTFDSVGEGDELQAELESKLVYDIFMKQNNGFLNLYEFAKDAFIQQNGFFKVFYSDETKVVTDSFTGLTEIEYNIIIADDDVEVLEESIEYDETDTIPLFSIKTSKRIQEKKLNVVCVPPEEFRCNNFHNSVDLDEARFTAHLTLTTRSDLVSMGFDKGVVYSLPASANNCDTTSGQYRFSGQGESTWDDTYDESQELVEFIECYMRLDVDEDGISELVQVSACGWDTVTTVLDVTPIDENPFISGTAIIMPHKLRGLSLKDRLIQIQNQKTALWRNILDNMYLQNNQRMGVIENQVNLDDLLISRPGGIVRIKTADALVPIITAPLSSDSYKMMDYLDQVRAGRAGVSPEGTISDSMIGDRMGSEGIEKIMNQKEELVGLMVRVLAETAIKPLMYKIRNQLVKHQDAIMDYKFRGEWAKVDPKRWKVRKATTVRVGTGSGNRKQQMATLGALRAEQKEVLMKPGQILVTPKHEYNLLNDLAKLGGFAGAGSYFLDPESPEGKQNMQIVSTQSKEAQDKAEMKDTQLLQAQIKIANAEESKAVTASENARLKNDVSQGQNMLTLQKQQSEAQVDFLKQRLQAIGEINDSDEFDEEMTFKYWDKNQHYRLEKAKLNKSEKKTSNG